MSENAISKKYKTIKDKIDNNRDVIMAALPKMIGEERMVSIILNALRNTPKLLQCTEESILGGIVKAVQLGLEVNDPLGESYLIPYFNKKKGCLESQFQIGYKGYINLFYRSDRAKAIYHDKVYEGDEFKVVSGSDERKIIHNPSLKRDSSKPAIAYYVVAKLSDSDDPIFVWATREEMEEFAKRFSQSANSAISPWKVSFDEMAFKTLYKRLSKYLPITKDIARAVGWDETTSGVEHIDRDDTDWESIIEVDAEVVDNEELSEKIPDIENKEPAMKNTERTKGAYLEELQKLSKEQPMFFEKAMKDCDQDPGADISKLHWTTLGKVLAELKSYQE